MWSYVTVWQYFVWFNLDGYTRCSSITAFSEHKGTDLLKSVWLIEIVESLRSETWRKKCILWSCTTLKQSWESVLKYTYFFWQPSSAAYTFTYCGICNKAAVLFDAVTCTAQDWNGSPVREITPSFMLLFMRRWQDSESVWFVVSFRRGMTVNSAVTGLLFNITMFENRNIRHLVWKIMFIMYGNENVLADDTAHRTHIDLNKPTKCN